MRRLTPFILSSLLAATASAQEHQHDHAMAVEGGGKFPPGWTARPDEDGRLTSVKLEAMPPGWHVTMGASAILYRAADTVAAAYHVSSKMHLFPSAGAQEEGFGLFIGGQNLGAANQRYTYFLIRGDGTFKIKRRNGAEVSDVTKDWTPSPAINKASSAGPVANELTVNVGKEKVSFLVNSQEVYAAPADSVDTSGIVGLRMNHNLSIHVEALKISNP